MIRYRVTFTSRPARTFVVRASTDHEAHCIAVMIENLYERPMPRRERTLRSAIVDALTAEEPGEETNTDGEPR